MRTPVLGFLLMGASIAAWAQDFVPHVYLGHLVCENQQTVAVRVNPNRKNSFSLHFKGRSFNMTSVNTPSGAVRLEDKQAGVIWVQLNSKSMLMDQQRGVRLVDECQHPDQAAMANAMAAQPAVNLLDANPSGR